MHQIASDQLKTSLAEDIVIAYPKFNEPLIVATDASNVGIGGVLSQIINLWCSWIKSFLFNQMRDLYTLVCV